MKRIILLGLMVVSGCSGYGILQTEPMVVDVEGWDYEVYVEHDRVLSRLAEPVLMPAPWLVHERAITAIRRATGCRPDPEEIYQSYGVVRSRLICS